jgi:hypothetical protein
MWLLAVLAVLASVSIAALVMTNACVLPLQFEEEVDGGIDRDYPPVLVSSDPVMPGFSTIEISQPDQIYVLSVEDKDLTDRLFVRVFRDYDPTPGLSSPAIAEKTVESSGERLRHIELSTAAWCNNVTPGTRSTYDVVIADRAYLDPPATPEYQAVPEGAERVHGAWVITCE